MTAPLLHCYTCCYLLLDLFFYFLYLFVIKIYFIYIYQNLFKNYFTLFKIQWRWGVSIPLPLACEANALPSELHPPVCLYLLLCFLPFSCPWPLYTPLFFLAKMHPVGFEPTHLSIAVLETAPLDHSGTNASLYLLFIPRPVPSPFPFF